MLNPYPRRILLVASLTVLFVFPASTRADALEDAVRMLAKRTAAAAQANQRNCVSWGNHEAISEARSLQLHNTFLAELGIEPGGQAGGGASCAIEVVVERTPTQIVLVAGIGAGEAKRVLISEIPRSEAPAATAASASARLEKVLLWQQGEPILDTLELRDQSGRGSRFLILTREAVSIFQPEAGEWKLMHKEALPSANGTERAPQGELRVGAGAQDEVQILLRGRSCRINVSQGGPLNCQPAANSWREEMLRVPGCDHGTWGLRSDSGDWSVPDRILLVNALLPKAQTLLTGINLPGPVLSLAPANVPGAYTAAVFNLSTGNYEVYRVTLACGY